MSRSRLNVLTFFHPGLACTAIGILIAAAPAALAQDSEREKHYQQYLQDHTDASGAVRPDLLQKGAEYVKHMKITAGIAVKKGGGPGAASVDKIGPKIASPGSITGVQWTGVGPASMPVDSNQPVMGSGPVSGEVVDIAIDQRGTADQVIYIATNDGGIWKTSDGGNSWATTMDSMPSLSMGAVALDPNNPSIVYAGTGDPFDGSGRYCCNGSPNLKAVGIYKSIDAGNTWQQINPFPTFAQFPGIFTGLAINRIVVLPSNSNVVLVATASNGTGGGGLFRSVDGGQNFGSNPPTFNDGNPILAPGTFISDLKVDTSNGSVLAAVSGVGILQSTDGGVTFPTNVFPGTGPGQATLTDAFSNVTFAQSTLPTNKTIYAMVTSTTAISSTNNGLRMEGLYKSIDYGTTWSQILPYNWPVNDPRTPGAQLPYDQTVGVDPQNPNLIYFGIVGMWGATDGGAGGPTSFNGVGDSQIHNDHHGMAFSPSTHWSGPTTAIYDGSDGGVSKSVDGGTTWTNIDNGLATELFFSMSMGLGSAGNSNQYMYGALQDLGNPDHRPTMGAAEWHLNTGGDGFAVAADASSGNGANAYARYNGTTQYTIDGGMSWIAQTLTGLGAGGVNSLTTDPNNGATVYTTQNNQLCRGSHSGTTISFTCFGALTANVGPVATAQIDSNTLWVGLVDNQAGTLPGTGRVARIDNALSATPTVTEYSTGAPRFCGGSTCGVRGIAIDPTNTATVVVVYPGFSGLSPSSSTQHVFMTTDNGSTWNDITGTPGGTDNLPDLPLNSVVIDPGTSPHSIIVASDVSVMRSADLGQTWQVFGVGFPSVLATDLKLDTSVTPSLLRVSTYGRSVFELTAASGPLISVNSNLAFGTVCIGQTATSIVQIFNVGSTDLHISSITRVSGSSDFTVLSGPPTPVTIPPGEELDYTIQFKPTGFGNETAVFQINSDDPFQPAKQLFASGTGGSATITTAIPNSGSFGNVCRGSFFDLPLTIGNSNACTLSVTNITSSGNPPFVPPGVSFPISIEGGGSTPVSLRFAPNASSTATVTGSFTIASNDPVTPSKVVGVSGTSLPPMIAVSGSTTFGDVCGGSVSEKILQVANTGPCDLHVTSASINCPDFTIQNNPFPATISHDASLNLTIAFTPTSSGPKSCTLTITSDDPAHPTLTFPLTANTPTNQLDVPASLTYLPEVTQNIGSCHEPLPLTINNRGSCPLKVTSMTITGVNAGDYSYSGLPSFPVPLQPGHTVGDGGLNMVFAPAALSRNRLATSTVQYESDPITHALATASTQACGEGVYTGVRILVTAGGIPLSIVDSIMLQRVTGNKNKPILNTVDNAKNLLLTNVIPTSPCAPFSYHREFGTVANPSLLVPGSYIVTVDATVNGKKVKQSVSFDVNTCGFNPTVVVQF